MPLAVLLAIAGIVADPCAGAPAPAATPPADAQAAFRAGYQDARRHDWADTCHYHADDRRIAAAPAADRQVVFMGDSITENWVKFRAGFFTGGWIDRGVSGQTTPQMLVRFPGDVLALHPRVVHIMAGTNDIAGNTGPATLDQVEANIAAMVTLAKAGGIRVVLAATPPSAGFRWAPGIQPAATIAALNARLRALAARENVVWVDYGTVLATPDGALQPRFTSDGTHPNADGYAAIEPLTRAAVAKALR